MDIDATGLKGELSAQKYLKDIGYRIVGNNISYPKIGEIDIIAMDGQVMVFVEVKTRADNRFGSPLEAVTKAKQQKVVAASRVYLTKNSIRCGGFRYDVIAIEHDKIQHIKNAFYARWR